MMQNVRQWVFWTLNGQAKCFLAGTELLAIVLLGVALTHHAPSSADLTRFVLILIAAIGYAELGGRVELIRRYVCDDPGRAWTNYVSVWAFAAVCVLPPGLAALLTAVIFAHVLFDGHRKRSLRPHRTLFTASTVVLSTLAGAEVLAHLPHVAHGYASIVTAAGIVIALVLFWLVNLGVLLAGMALAIRPPCITDLLPERGAVGFEYVTLTLGVVTGEFILHVVWLTPLVLVLIATTHRSSLVADLRVAASTDTKTGLLNAAAWREQSRQRLSYAIRANQSACVLLLDLDHFKAVNDTYGHLAGDDVLVRVADALRGEVRGHDVVGRFGGEEFVIFLDAASMESATAIAERVRERVAICDDDGVRVTASIGVAHTTTASNVDLDQLIEAADRSLYSAKAGGRNTVRTVRLSETLSRALSQVYAGSDQPDPAMTGR